MKINEQSYQVLSADVGHDRGYILRYITTQWIFIIQQHIYICHHWRTRPHNNLYKGVKLNVSKGILFEYYFIEFIDV